MVLTLGLLSLMICSGGIKRTTSAQATGVTIFAVTTGNNLLRFDGAAPGTISRTTPITGLQAGESILGIDFNPRTGQLIALGSTSRIYMIETTTGAATQIGTTSFNPALNGTAFGFDVNPVANRIRIVSEADQNLQLNPATGAVAATDTSLAYAMGDANAGTNPNIAGAAYIYNVSATTLYGIDSNLDLLVRQGSLNGTPSSPNTGQLFTVGSLGINTTAEVGFDISALNGEAYASLTSTGATSSSLYTINLTTGAATLVGAIGGTEAIRDLTVAVPALTLANVSAASYQGAAVATESIVAGFGTNLATRNVATVSVPLPTEIAGTTLKMLDSAGIERLAPLYLVSANQINYQIPPGTASGIAIITNTSGDGTISTGVVQIAPVAPGIFAANVNGREVAAANVLRARGDLRTYEPVARFDPSQLKFVPIPIDLGPETDQVFLVLYGTGFRFYTSLATVSCQIGGTNSEVLFVGKHEVYVGVDQANVRLPRSLIGRGLVDVVLTVDGQVSNTVQINIL